MPSHFSTIGFAVESEDDMSDVANRAAETATRIATKKGTYLYWHDESGAELWIQADRRGDLIGMNPHYSGRATMPVELQSLIADSDHPLDGAFPAWANPGDGHTEDGDYPFLFDCPDAMAHRDVLLPSRATAQIAAFAHEATVFDSEKGFDEWQKDQELEFAAQSFIPSGLFSPEGEEPDRPSALGIFTGSILAGEPKVNGLSGNRFYWALVEKLGGQFDVVLDESLVERAPPTGGIITGSFWLSGRLTDHQKRKSWLRRIIG